MKDDQSYYSALYELDREKREHQVRQHRLAHIVLAGRPGLVQRLFNALMSLASAVSRNTQQQTSAKLHRHKHG